MNRSGIRAAPLVDVPVVVRLDHHEVDVAVGALVQHLAGEAGPVGEVEARELTAGRHVADALVHVVATGAHVLVAQRVDVEELRRLARDRVQSEVPAADVAVVPLLRAVGFVDDTRRRLAVPRGNVRVEHVRRFADVIVDRDEDESSPHAAPVDVSSTDDVPVDLRRRHDDERHLVGRAERDRGLRERDRGGDRRGRARRSRRR